MLNLIAPSRQVLYDLYSQVDLLLNLKFDVCNYVFPQKVERRNPFIASENSRVAPVNFLAAFETSEAMILLVGPRGQ